MPPRHGILAQLCIGRRCRSQDTVLAPRSCDDPTGLGRHTQTGGKDTLMSQGGELFPDGEAYERLMGRWSRLAGEAFLDWLDVPKGLEWLDVGCGNGAFTEVLITRSAPAAVAAIDPSNGQLAYARARPGTKLAQFQQ